MPKENLLEFYGEECPHCETMKPLVERLKKEVCGATSYEKLKKWALEKYEK